MADPKSYKELCMRVEKEFEELFDKQGDINDIIDTFSLIARKSKDSFPMHWYADVKTAYDLIGYARDMFNDIGAELEGLREDHEQEINQILKGGKNEPQT